MRVEDFLSGAGNISLDVQLHKVIAQAVGDALCQNVCAVQRNLVGSGDVVVHLDREGDAQSGQLLDGLLFVLLSQFGIQTEQGLAIFFWQSHLFAYQLDIVGAVRGVNQALHGVEVVLADHWGNGIDAGVVFGDIPAVIEGLAERLVGDGCIPVGVRGAILKEFVVIEVDLVGVFVCGAFYQIVIIVVVLVAADGDEVGLRQVGVIDLASLIELEGDVGGLDHTDGNGIKQEAILIPVSRVLGEDLLVALYIGGHGVASIVPHRLVVHRFDAVDAQLINEALRDRVEASVGRNRVEVRLWRYAVVNDGVIIRQLNADHFHELGAIAGIQRVCFLHAQGLGIFVILVGALNHFERHGCIGRIVLVEVEDPLQRGRKVAGDAVGLLVGVHVDPFDSFAQVEGPGQAAILGAPVLCNGGC